MKGYFVTEAQISNLKERLELEKLQVVSYGVPKKQINAINKVLHERMMRQLEDWLTQISK